MKLINKGLKYNKKWIQIIAIEADTAISQLPDKYQGYMGQLVANNIQQLINEQKTLKDQRTTTHTKHEYHEWNTIKTPKQKINQNKLIITKHDKGNALLIIHKDDNYNKIEEFIDNNNYHKTFLINNNSTYAQT
jgi:hypothetical protein